MVILRSAMLGILSLKINLKMGMKYLFDQPSFFRFLHKLPYKRGKILTQHLGSIVDLTQAQPPSAPIFRPT